MSQHENSLRVPVVQSPLPCEECGQPGPSLQWTVPEFNMAGVLCRSCLDKVVSQINRALAATAGDTTEPGQGQKES